MSGFFDIYSIIFLIIAVVIFMRLGSVLGRRTGNEPTSNPYDNRVKAPQPGARTDAARNDNVVALPPRDRAPATQAEPANIELLSRHAAPGTPAHDGLVAIARATPGFDAGHFIAGAKAAYEMVVTAFAQGDRATLKGLLAPDVYDGFVAAIDAREAKGEKAELTFVGIDEAKITGAELDGTSARIALRVVAELISVTKAKDGTVVDGDPTEVQTIRDAWTFARETSSRDPNWKLVATETA